MQEWTDNPWERQKGETEKAFEAFTTYRDLGEKRTVSAVCKKLEKSRSLIDRWKERWDWPERVRAYDNELEREAKAKAVKELREMTSRHIKIALALQQKALEALKDLPIVKMEPKDIKEYIKVSTELERLNREITDEEKPDQEASKAPMINIICDIPRELRSAAGNHVERMEDDEND